MKRSGAGFTKGVWLVKAGIIPGTPIEDYSKSWEYTNRDLEKDLVTANPRSEATAPSIFDQKMEAAYDYARSIHDPTQLSWIVVEWIWI